MRKTWSLPEEAIGSMSRIDESVDVKTKGYSDAGETAAEFRRTEKVRDRTQASAVQQELVEPHAGIATQVMDGVWKR